MDLKPLLLALACSAALPSQARPVITLIGAVQGSGPVSPLQGQRLSVEGRVTADMRAGLGGFFLRGAEDGRPDTSDGLFVQTQPGDTLPEAACLRVTGTVDELRSGKGDASLTTLKAERIQAISCRRLPAAAAIELDALPADWEAYEGMKVRITAPLTLAGLHGLQRNGEVVAAFGGRLWQPSELAVNGSEAYAAIIEDNVRRTLVLAGGSQGHDPDRERLLPTAATARVGMLLNAVEGVVDQRFSSGYRIQLTSPLALPPLERPGTPPTVAGTVKVAAFNLENYFNGDGAGGGFPTPRGAKNVEQMLAQQAKLVAALNTLGADVAALMELENDGYGPDSSIAQLVTALNADGNGPGDWRFVDAGKGPGTNTIRVGIIYRASVLKPVGKPVVLEDGPFAEHSRVPLTQAFRRGKGEAFTVTAIHLKSKGCGKAEGGDLDNGDGCFNATRTESVRRIGAWLATDPTGVGSLHAVVLGDYNAHAREEPLRVLESKGWRDAFAIAGVERPYSYVYNALSGRLDHALISPSLAPLLRGAAEWHINADESDAAGYGQGNVPGPWRSSDHDPMLIGLDL